MNEQSASSELAVPIDAVFVGAVGPLANDGAPSGIDKRAVDDPCWLDLQGVAGDEQADHVHHAGPERALNHYPAEHYAHWRAQYPGFADGFVPGAFGENISTQGLTEANVCVGDVFALGDAVIELAQPRQPCWKIGARLGISGLDKALVLAGRAGWLYRVREPGAIRVGDMLTRVENAVHGITLAELWAAHTARRPTAEQRAQMKTLAEQPTLAPEWRKRLARRVAG